VSVARGYLGLDVGSVSTNMVVIAEDGSPVTAVYLRTRGEPIGAVQEGLRRVQQELPGDFTVLGVGATGSARQLGGVIVGADVVKNEITAHAVAASEMVPSVQTVLEIGGQDSKIIIIRDGVIADFAMNTVCAAGTGSFLDQQAARLGLPIEELGEIALKSESPVRIAGRCTVFAESDMVHKQQLGYRREDIVYGLCKALVRNYLNNVGRGKQIAPVVVFQGGVAANAGICRAFEEALGTEVIVPRHFGCMGALGAAMLSREEMEHRRQQGRDTATHFRGFGGSELKYRASSFECHHCPNSCEVIEISCDGEVLARWGGRCPRWDIVSEGKEGVALAVK
jgi:predicted CoA-substrate-specific enzyme activase